jgi:biotin carboxyl carrier protein
MASFDAETVRHALETARRHSIHEVVLQSGDASFHAVLKPVKAKRRAPAAAGESAATAEAPAAPTNLLLKSNVVGYLRQVLIQPGDVVEKGQKVAVVEALGLANEVGASAAGTVEEVLVAVGDPVEFNQVLARVKP